MSYEGYVYRKEELLRYGVMGFFISCFILMLFYQSFLFSFLVSIPITIVYLKYYKRVLIHQRRKRLMIQFKDLMESLMSALSAGYSMENAIYEAKKDLRLMYTEDSLILHELTYMIQRMEIGYEVEQLLIELGNRSKLEDIEDFSKIYITAKKTGGNLVTVMRQTAKNISEKLEIKRELDTLISSKKLESKFMSIIPLFIILYLQISSPGFLNPLYHGLFGRVVMTGALILYIGSFLWTKKIMDIEF